jgi:hypothetical protein
MNCKYCGDEITKTNKYIFNTCNKSSCRRKRLRVCDEDCLNCVYEDCQVDASKLPSEKLHIRRSFKKKYQCEEYHVLRNAS